MAHINPLYETLAGELSGLREYDLFGRVKMGALQKTGGYSSVHDGTLGVYPSANASQGSSVATEIRVAVKCLRFLTNADIKAVKVKLTTLCYILLFEVSVNCTGDCKGAEDMDTSPARKYSPMPRVRCS